MPVRIFGQQIEFKIYLMRTHRRIVNYQIMRRVVSICHAGFLLVTSLAEMLAEKVVHVVIPGGARNLSGAKIKGMRDSSAKSMPRNESLPSFPVG